MANKRASSSGLYVTSRDLYWPINYAARLSSDVPPFALGFGRPDAIHAGPIKKKKYSEILL